MAFQLITSSFARRAYQFIDYITFVVFTGFSCWMFWISSKKLCYVAICWYVHVLAIHITPDSNKAWKVLEKRICEKYFITNKYWVKKNLNLMYAFDSNCISCLMQLIFFRFSYSQLWSLFHFNKSSFWFRVLERGSRYYVLLGGWGRWRGGL